MMGRALSIPFLAFPARFLWSLSPATELTTVSINGQGSKEEATVVERPLKMGNSSHLSELISFPQYLFLAVFLFCQLFL